MEKKHMDKKTKYAIVGVILLVVIVIAFWPSDDGSYDPYRPDRWTFEAHAGEQIEYWITQEMITCVGSDEPEDLFANVDPTDATVIVFQQDASGNWHSYVSGRPGNTLNHVRTDASILLACNADDVLYVITIYRY